MKYFLLLGCILSFNVQAIQFNFLGTIFGRAKSSQVDYFNDGSGVALYSLDENGFDKSGNYSGTNFGTLVNNSKLINGIQYEDTKSLLVPRILVTPAQATFSFWVYPQSTTNAVSFFGIPADLLSWNAGNQRGFAFAYNYANQDWGDGTTGITNGFHIYNAGNTNSDISQNLSATLPKSQWNHVVFSFSQPTLTIYINGTSVGSVSHPNWTYLANFNTSAQGTKWRIGDASYTTNNNTAIFDQIRAFNRALSAAEVARLYTHP